MPIQISTFKTPKQGVEHFNQARGVRLDELGCLSVLRPRLLKRSDPPDQGIEGIPTDVVVVFLQVCPVIEKAR
ncbi:MAG: hypothetical protein ACN6OP_30160, partial [Pseudomonadales bacterium]